MAIYYTNNSKLIPDGTQLFDSKSIKTGYGYDIDINSSGAISRLIGLDKLEQQVQKAVIVKKGSYPTAKSLGSNIINATIKDKIFLNAEIRETLATYAKLQQQTSTSFLKVLGKNIYRTMDITDASSWRKINSHIISSNTYTDSNLIPSIFYYYAVTTVYRDTLGNTSETNIDKYENIIASTVNSLQAKVNDTFVLVSGNKSAILYWSIPVKLNEEEQLRSIIDIILTQFGDPRGLNIKIKVTNKSMTQSQINLLKTR